MVPLVREGLGRPFCPRALSVFERRVRAQRRHTPLSNPSISAQPPAGKGVGGGVPGEEAAWFLASSQAPWYTPALPLSFSSFLPFIPSDAVCGEKHAQGHPALLGAERLRIPALSPGPRYPSPLELCLMTVTIKDFLLRRVKEDSLMGPGPKANPYLSPDSRGEKEKKKKMFQQMRQRASLSASPNPTGTGAPKSIQRCQHS